MTEGFIMDKLTEGWKWLMNATKWHYFVDHESLCGRWMTFSMNDIEQGNDRSSDNCKMCRRKLMARYETSK
jgi:hypothetical protein